VAIPPSSYAGRFIEPYVQPLMQTMPELCARGIATGWIPLDVVRLLEHGVD